MRELLSAKNDLRLGIEISKLNEKWREDDRGKTNRDEENLEIVD